MKLNQKLKHSLKERKIKKEQKLKSYLKKALKIKKI